LFYFTNQNDTEGAPGSGFWYLGLAVAFSSHSVRSIVPPGYPSSQSIYRLSLMNFEVIPLSTRINGGKSILPTVASKNSAGTQARNAAKSREYPRKPIRYSPAAERRRMAQVRATV
jgi:hypothetical protein